MKKVAKLVFASERTKGSCERKEKQVSVEEVEFLLTKYQKEMLDQAFLASKKKTFVSMTECVSLRWKYEKSFSMLKVLKTEVRKPLRGSWNAALRLKAVFGRIAYSFIQYRVEVI